MFEKVNPSHPDKVADRIAGAIVDLAYKKEENPKIAVEVLIGHGQSNVIVESSVEIEEKEVQCICDRILGTVSKLNYTYAPQDHHLANNQREGFRCGDNGIFKGFPITEEEKILSFIVRDLYKKYHCDGKYILDNKKLTVCQSNVSKEQVRHDLIYYNGFNDAVINPLGDWTGGYNVDSGATNRKLGSDMAQSVTGGGLHGKDLSKADVSVNIYAFLKAQRDHETVELSCAIGDDVVDGRPYSEIVQIAREYIKRCGGFEKFAEWGLV